MKVHLEDYIDDNKNTRGLYIESDTAQFIIKEYNGKTDSKGNPQSRNVAYFTDMIFLLKYVLSMRIKADTAETVQELLSRMTTIDAYIRTQSQKVERKEAPESATEGDDE